MDDETLFHVSEFEAPDLDGYQTMGSPDSAVLMDMIFRYLDQESPKQSYPTTMESKLPSVKRWADSLPDFEISPMAPILPKYNELDDASIHSNSSSIGSMLSDSLSSQDSNGPKTPPLNTTVNETAQRQSHDELHFPEIPSLPMPERQVNINRKCSLRRSQEVARSPSRPTPRVPKWNIRAQNELNDPNTQAVSTPKQQMQATITSLDDVMPEFVPAPK